MRRALLFVFLALSALCLSAGGAKERKPEGETVTIKYAFWGNPDAVSVEQGIISAFERSHPGIHVEPIVESGYNEYHSKIMTMIAGGMGPDVIRLDCYFYQDFYNLGALECLDPYIEASGFDTSIYPKAALEEAELDGHLYALPWATAPIYMAVNLDTFEKAGIDLPSYDWTLDDFVSLLHQFGGDSTGVYGWATQMSNHPLYPFIWACGSNFFNEDRTHYAMNDEGGREALGMLAELYSEGCLPRAMITTTTAEPVTRWFSTGTVAMMTASAQEILALQNIEGVRFELYPFPGGESVKNTTILKNNEVAITSASAHKEAAWEFLSFLRGLEGEKLYVSARRIPPSLAVEADFLWSLYLGDTDKYPHKLQEVTMLIAEKYGHSLPLRSGYSEIDITTVPFYQRIISGNLGVEEGLEQLGEKIEAIIERNGR